MGIMKHLAAFLRMLPELCRVSYLPILHEVLHSTNPFNWRLRQNLALQLSQLVALPRKPDVYKTLFPTIMTLLQDPVASVRRETFQGVSAFVLAIYEVAYNVDQTYNANEVTVAKKNLGEIIRAINQFITSDKCYLRQLWMELARQLLKDLPTSFFETEFLHGVFKLALDRVLNVRLAVAIFLAGWWPEYPAPWEEDGDEEDSVDGATDSAAAGSSAAKATKKPSPWIWLLNRMDVKRCVERLSKDDRDVYLNVSQLRVIYPDIEFRQFSCRGRKTPPGGVTPLEIDPTPVPKLDLTLLESAILTQEKERLRSSSSASLRQRSSSIEGLEEHVSSGGSSRSHPVFLVDDDDNSPKLPTSPSAAVLESEHEFIPELLNADAIEELDIIDGILRSPTTAPTASTVPRSFLSGSSGVGGHGDDDDEVDEEEEKRIAAGLPLPDPMSFDDEEG